MEKKLIFTLVVLAIGTLIVYYTFKSTLLSVIINANTVTNKINIDDTSKDAKSSNIIVKPNTAMNYLKISRDIEVVNITTKYMTLYVTYIVFIYILSLF